MRRRNLGGTDIRLTELSLGTWGLCGDGYGAVPESEQDRVIERAVHLGLRCFETATSYACGAMERRLGRVLADVPEACFVTKLGTEREGSPPRKRFDRQYLAESFEQSSERLRRETIDVVLLHNPPLSALERGEATAALAALQEAGRIRCWGVSAGSAPIARAALARGASVVSVALNVFHSSTARALADDLAAARAGLLAHSPLAYGLLAGLWGADRVFPPGDHRAERWTPEELRLRLRQLDALRPLVQGEVATLRGAAVRWVLAQASVTSVVLGPRSVVQLDQLVREYMRAAPPVSAPMPAAPPPASQPPAVR